MKVFRRVLLVLLLLVLVALVAGYWYERPLLRTGTGYAAHNHCAVTRVAGRDNPDADLPPNPLVPFLRSKAISDGGSQATLLGVLARQRAWYTPGFGCTLADSRPRLGRALPVTAAGNPFTHVLAPHASPPVAAAVARAFGQGLPTAERRKLGTRAVLVVMDGRLIAERYAPGFGSTPQLGWSMSKSVANLLVGRLVQQGRVSLDDNQLLSSWTDERANITIEDLLRMTSGLAWDETYALGTPITQMLYDEPDMGRFVAGQPAAHAPGTHLQYSSGSTTLLCAILAERTGDGPNLPRKEIFRPLGLSSAVMEPDAAGTPVCSSYMWASPRDWAAVGQFALQDGVWHGKRLLPEGWMRRSTTAIDVPTQETEAYGAGWWVNRWPDGRLVWPSLPPDTYAAEGHDGQWMIIVPSQRLVVLRLGFSPTLEEVGAVRLTADVIAATRQ